jgi:uncharacterized protein
MRRTIAIACATAAFAAPAAAQAHVTLQPKETPAGGFARLDVRVPNERDDASTKEVQVKFPPGFIFASYEPVAGWTVDVAKRKLAKPVESHGEQITEEIDTITWTGEGPQGEIGPGQFQDFGLSLGMPDEPGKALVFKSLQTYSGGEVVRWIGAEDSDSPAPIVTLTSSEGEHGAAAKPADDDTASDGGDGAPTWRAIAARAVGALGLIVGLAAMGKARSRQA